MSLPDNFYRLTMRDHIKRAVKKFGLEGTEDKIKELYKNHPILREKYLKVYYAFLNTL